MIKISAVSYRNAQPMMMGLQQSEWMAAIDLQLDIPAVSALKFMNNEVDVALLPTGVLPQLGDYKICSSYCIGAHDQVKTVAIFSKVPLENVERIYLDYHSRTSVILIKILLNEYFKLPHIVLLPATENMESKIQDKEAALLIGDKTFPLLNTIPYQYDLATAWYQHTGLPFVFAAWVAKPAVSDEFLTNMNKALKEGIDNRSDLVQQLQKEFPTVNWQEYFYHCIQYEMDEPKQKGLQLFLQKLKQY